MARSKKLGPKTELPPAPMRRGVRCALCRREMFYSGDTRFEPELWVFIEIGQLCGGRDHDGFRAHTACWEQVARTFSPRCSVARANTAAVIVRSLKTRFPAAKPKT